MGPIDDQRLHLLTQNNINDCLALSAEAGWNQRREDWDLFLQRGRVLGLLDDRERAVATGAILPYPNGFSWISMVLVIASRRRERIGTRILQACIAEIVGEGLLPVLDATPAGEQVYRPLGFKSMLGISRWQGVAGNGGDLPPGLRAMTGSDIPQIAAIDALAFGADRAFLIENFFERMPQLALVTEDLAGFAVARPGRSATQIGPIVAPNEPTALRLLNAVLNRASGPIFLDLIDQREEIQRTLRDRAFTVQRPFARMALDRREPLGNPAHLFAVAGPEFG